MLSRCGQCKPSAYEVRAAGLIPMWVSEPCSVVGPRTVPQHSPCARVGDGPEGADLPVAIPCLSMPVLLVTSLSGGISRFWGK